VVISCGVNSWSPNDNVGNMDASEPSSKTIAAQPFFFFTLGSTVRFMARPSATKASLSATTLQRGM
jgi:hypothetical protein